MSIYNSNVSEKWFYLNTIGTFMFLSFLEFFIKTQGTTVGDSLWHTKTLHGLTHYTNSVSRTKYLRMSKVSHLILSSFYWYHVPLIFVRFLDNIYLFTVNKPLSCLKYLFLRKVYPWWPFFSMVLSLVRFCLFYRPVYTLLSSQPSTIAT